MEDIKHLQAAALGNSSLLELRELIADTISHLKNPKAQLECIKAIFNATSSAPERFSAVLVQAWAVLGKRGWTGGYLSLEEAKADLDTTELKEARQFFGRKQRQKNKEDYKTEISSLWQDVDWLELDRRGESILKDMAQASTRFSEDQALDILPKIALRRLRRDSQHGGASSRNVTTQDWKKLVEMSVLDIAKVSTIPGITIAEKAKFDLQGMPSTAVDKPLVTKAGRAERRKQRRAEKRLAVADQQRLEAETINQQQREVEEYLLVNLTIILYRPTIHI